MAKVFTGRDGQLLFTAVGGEPVVLAKVASYSFQADLEVLETTTLGDNLRYFTPGIVGWAGNATLLYYKDDNNVVIVNRLLRRLIKTGIAGVIDEDDASTSINDSGLVTFVLRLVDGAQNRDIKFNAYLTSASIGVSVGEVVQTQVTFQVTGPLLAASF